VQAICDFEMFAEGFEVGLVGRDIRTYVPGKNFKPDQVDKNMCGTL